MVLGVRGDSPSESPPDSRAAVPFPHRLAADNGQDPLGFIETVTAGETCFIVPLDDDFAQPGGTYALMWIDPGDLFIALLTDGFESGDTSAGSSVTP